MMANINIINIEANSICLGMFICSMFFNLLANVVIIIFKVVGPANSIQPFSRDIIVVFLI